ncbi:hypothetical protein V6N13_000124 [Hibiscus sabdariffa]
MRVEKSKEDSTMGKHNREIFHLQPVAEMHSFGDLVSVQLQLNLGAFHPQAQLLCSDSIGLLEDPKVSAEALEVHFL